MVKTIEDNIKKAFTDLGFTAEEVKEGCWLLERKVQGIKKPLAWIAKHKFLERACMKAGMIFDKPEVLDKEQKQFVKKEVLKYSAQVAIYVNGHYKDKQCWSIGEASPSNNDNDYPWAMAEKRAKDRVILKLLDLHGDIYSEDEMPPENPITNNKEDKYSYYIKESYNASDIIYLEGLWNDIKGIYPQTTEEYKQLKSLIFAKKGLLENPGLTCDVTEKLNERTKKIINE